MKGDGEKRPAVGLLALFDGKKKSEVDSAKHPPGDPAGAVAGDDEEPDARLAAKQLVKAIDAGNPGGVVRAFRALHAATCPACAGDETEGTDEGESPESEE